MKLLVWALACGAGAYLHNFYAVGWIVHLGIFLFVILLWRNECAGWSVLLVMFLLGNVSAGMSAPKSILEPSQRYVVDARVCSNAIPKQKYVVMHLCVKQATTKQKTFGVDQKIKTSFFSTLFPQKGDVIRAKLKVKSSPYTQQLVGSVSRDQDWAWLYQVPVNWQRRVDQKAKELLPVESFQIYQALLLGDAGYLNQIFKQSLVHLGLIHLFVFSGFHVGVLYGLFYFLVGAVIAFVSNALFRKKIQVLVSWLFVTGFLYSSLEFSMPTFRAWVFLTLYVLHICLGVARHIDFVLLLTVLISIVVEPARSFSVSSYLSFAAVIGIVWSLRLVEVGNVKKIGSKIKTNFVVCMGAFLWTVPILLYNFEQVNIISFIYNFFLVPVLGVAMIVSSIVLHVLLFFNISWLQIAVAKIQTMVTKVFVMLVQLLANNSLGLVSTDWVGKWAIYAIFGSLIITYLYLENQSKKQKIIKINL